MGRREKLSPGFSISHSIEQDFPSKEEFSNFGYEPFDIFMTSEIAPGEPLDSRLTLGSENASELVENLSADIFMVFRYRRKNSEKQPGESTSSVSEVPEFKREAHPASLIPGSDFHVLEELLDTSIDEITDADYMYSSDPSSAKPEGCKTIGDYMHGLQGENLTAWPEIYGINELNIRPQDMSIEMKLYQQEVYIERSGRNGENNRHETVHLNYDESRIEELEENLVRSGFKVERNYLPQTISPPDI